MKKLNNSIFHFETKSNKRKDKYINSQNSIKELEILFKEKFQIINIGNKKNNAIFRLSDGKFGVAIVDPNNTGAGKIDIIRKIAESEGQCLIYMPQVFRKRKAIKRLVALMSLAIPNVEIIDKNWIKDYSTYNKILNNFPFGKEVKIKKYKNHIVIDYKCRSYPLAKEVEMLAIIANQNTSKKVILYGEIIGKQFDSYRLKELSKHNIDYYINWHNPETKKDTKFKNISKKIKFSLHDMIETPQIEKLKGELKIENIEKSNLNLKSNKNINYKSTKYFSRILSNDHKNLCIAFSDELRKQNIETKREYLHIDVLAIYENKLEIYEIKTADSQIYKGIGQLFSYKHKLEQKFPNKEILMNLVISKKCQVSNEFKEILNSLNITLIFK